MHTKCVKNTLENVTFLVKSRLITNSFTKMSLFLRYFWTHFASGNQLPNGHGVKITLIYDANAKSLSWKKQPPLSIGTLRFYEWNIGPKQVTVLLGNFSASYFTSHISTLTKLNRRCTKAYCNSVNWNIPD